VALLLLLAACGSPPKPAAFDNSDASAPVTATSDAAGALPANADGLAVGRHPQCDHAAAVLRYLQTGDNQGHPELDEQLANFVGRFTLPQARAKADAWVLTCDSTIDRQEAAEQQDELRREQYAQRQAEQAQKRAELTARELSECDGIGGHYQNQRCYSAVKGNPGGRAETSCTYQEGTPIWIGYDFDGNLITPSVTKSFYPGCFK
jgi:hypothetical protein